MLKSFDVIADIIVKSRLCEVMSVHSWTHYKMRKMFNEIEILFICISFPHKKMLLHKIICLPLLYCNQVDLRLLLSIFQCPPTLCKVMCGFLHLLMYVLKYQWVIIIITHESDLSHNRDITCRWLKTVSSTYILMDHYNHSLSLDTTIMGFKKLHTVIATVWPAKNALNYWFGGLIILKPHG